MTVISVTVIEMEYTLDELVAAVAARLQAAGLNRQSNGQVSAFPDRRTLRYYTTIGLMDRPDAVRDRQSLYGERHVNQAVAVKRLQAAGLALAAIQARLAGLPGGDVEAIASGQGCEAPSGIPGATGQRGDESKAAAGATRRPGEAPTGTSGRRRFWAEPSTPSAPATSPGDPGGVAQPMLAVALSPGATLLFCTDQPLTAADITGIRDAASVLLDYLDQLRPPEQPAPPSPERNPDDHRRSSSRS
jgi:DNA-binding transcriptional MerR regulator